MCNEILWMNQSVLECSAVVRAVVRRAAYQQYTVRRNASSSEKGASLIFKFSPIRES